KLDRLETAGARDDELGVDLSLHEHLVARLREVHGEGAVLSRGLHFAPFECAAEPSGRDGEVGVAAGDVEIVDLKNEGSACAHGRLCRPRPYFALRIPPADTARSPTC